MGSHLSNYDVAQQHFILVEGLRQIAEGQVESPSATAQNTLRQVEDNFHRITTNRELRKRAYRYGDLFDIAALVAALAVLFCFARAMHFMESPKLGVALAMLAGMMPLSIGVGYAIIKAGAFIGRRRLAKLKEVQS